MEKDFDAGKVEAEARSGRKFSLADVIAEKGKGVMKGASAVPPLTQAQNTISEFIRGHVRDSTGALIRTLEMRLRSNETLVAGHLQDPLAALALTLQRLLGTGNELFEFVRQVDMTYGQVTGDRPHFQRPGEDPHPDDEYTHASVRQALERLRAALEDH